MSEKLTYPEEVAVAEVAEVVSDIGEMTFEQMHVMSMAPDFGENKVLQSIVKKWKRAHGISE